MATTKRNNTWEKLNVINKSMKKYFLKDCSTVPDCTKLPHPTRQFKCVMLNYLYFRGGNSQRHHHMVLSRCISQNTILSRYCDILYILHYIMIFFTFFNCKSCPQIFVNIFFIASHTWAVVSSSRSQHLAPASGLKCELIF